MNSTGKVFMLVLGVIVALLLLHQLPSYSIGDMESRPVALLSDLWPETEKNEEAKAPVEPVRKAAVPKYRPKGVVLFDDYSGGKAGGMNHFFGKLLHAKSGGGAVRIAYFGDSFIEGDIMTCDLREMLQAKYGGSGPGWVDCGGGIGSNRPTVTTRHQGMKENVVIKKPFNSELEGISQRYYYASSGATVRLTGTKFKPHVGTWDKATLFFTTASHFPVQVSTSQQAAERFDFEPASEVQVLETRGNMTSVSYKFPSATNRTRLFGVALDGENGVALDNFSMRGTPGFMLAKIPLQTLKDIRRYRPYDLIVLQFGLNVVDDRTTEAMCRAYINRMKKVITLMRQAFPEASIAVFSVPDRVQRSTDGLHTLKGVERLVRYQRILASECGVAYLNVHQIMGGNDSMKSFVENGWAAKDYTHMNYKGGRIIANRIYQSILAGVENYRRENSNQ